MIKTYLKHWKSTVHYLTSQIFFRGLLRNSLDLKPMFLLHSKKSMIVDKMQTLLRIFLKSPQLSILSGYVSHSPSLSLVPNSQLLFLSKMWLE
jgi:hypothetical protein